MELLNNVTVNVPLGQNGWRISDACSCLKWQDNQKISSLEISVRKSIQVVVLADNFNLEIMVYLALSKHLMMENLVLSKR